MFYVLLNMLKAIKPFDSNSAKFKPFDCLLYYKTPAEYKTPSLL